MSEKLLFGKAGDVKDASRLYAFTSRAGISNARENSAAKGSNSFMWNTFKILFIYFILFFVFLNQMIDYGLIILVHWELNLQDILQIEYLLHIRFIRAKLHCL